MPTAMHCHERYVNNRAEVSHEHTRAQERQDATVQVTWSGATFPGRSPQSSQSLSRLSALVSCSQLSVAKKSIVRNVAAGDSRLPSRKGL
jgi:hypothetical protein